MDKATEKYILSQKEKEPTDKILSFYQERPQGYSASFFETIRQILVNRGVVGLADEEARAEPLQYAKQEAGAPIVLIGGLIGAFVGYLFASSPLLSIGAILTRGMFLDGIDLMLRPAAEHAFNVIAACGLIGAAAAGGVGMVISNQTPIGGAKPELSELRTCSNCGAGIPLEMKFCGKCGNSPTNKVCSRCAKPVPYQQSFCGGCGTPISKSAREGMTNQS